MSRAAIHEEEFTPFGLWIKQYGFPYMTVTNIDYLLLRVKGEKLFAMLLEEKTNNGRCTDAQRLAMRLLDDVFMQNNGQMYDFGRWGKKHVEYWGFYLLVFPKNATMPGPGMRLNKTEISAEQLAKHISFEKMFCAGLERSQAAGPVLVENV